MQIRYKDDPLLQPDVSDGVVKQWRHSEEHLDGGVMRTFILSKIPRVGESAYTVHYQHNQLNLDRLYDFCKKHGIQMFLLGDMKIGNLMLNLGNHSSFFSLLWNFWSQFVPTGSDFCQEQKERTITSCIEQANIRKADILAGEEKADKHYFNVKGMPMDLLVHIAEVSPDRSLLDLFPGGPLHYLLGVNTILDWLNKLLPGFVLYAIESPVSEGGLGRKSSGRRGKSDQNGNNCKRIAQSVEHLRQRLPSAETIQEQRVLLEAKQHAEVGIDVCNRFQAGLKAIDVLEEYNVAHSSVSKPPVNHFNLESFEHLEKRMDEYESLHRKVELSTHGRGVVTPKLRAFCKLVPKRCELTGMNMYYVNEQAGEAIHVRALREETNLPRCVAWLEKKHVSNVSQPQRGPAPAFATRSGRQHAQAAAKEAARSELEKLSQEKAALMDSLYAKSEKSWSLSSFTKSLDAEEDISCASSRRPALKDPCPADKVVRHSGNTDESKKVQLWSLQKLTRKSFPDHSRDRLKDCARRVTSGDTSAPPWMNYQWENFKT